MLSGPSHFDDWARRIRYSVHVCPVGLDNRGKSDLQWTGLLPHFKTLESHPRGQRLCASLGSVGTEATCPNQRNRGSGARLDYLFLSEGTVRLEMNTKFAAVTGVGNPAGSASWPSSTKRTEAARLFLSTQNNAPAEGKRAGGTRHRRHAAQRPEPVHLVESGRGTQHGGKQQWRGDLRLRAPERLGPAAQDEHPARTGPARPEALRCGGAAVLRSSRRR